ncbi:MAG: hypothetical protein KC736_03510 [Candidatus Moranbacteria bacterium]|nr:hypothetical protein [Candidatus Moranbacteria bacterium]
MIRKIFLFFLVFVQVFVFSAGQVLAVKVPSVGSIAAQLEERYHINTESVQDRSEDFNVSHRKEVAPEVQLILTPTDPKVGEDLTVTALPFQFTNTDSLYYTWFLQRAGCEADDDGNLSTDQEKCDLNDDGDIDVEDWKIEATREIFDRAFDYRRLDIDGDGDYDFDQLEIQIDEDDNDGVRAQYGGQHNRNTTAYCYIRDFSDGENYELAQASSEDFGCSGGATPRCVDEEYLVCPATIDATATASATGGTGGSGGGDGSGGSGGTGGDADSETSVSGETFKEYRLCVDTKTSPVCKSTSTSGGSTTGKASCATGVPYCISKSTDIPSSNNVQCDSISGNTTCSSLGTPITSCKVSESRNATNLCTHLFAQAGSKYGFGTGDNNFALSEEEFWRSNPLDKDSVDEGNKDEATVMGLNVKDFTWSYQPGDMIGVAVEGLALMSTKHDDASFMVMWALPKKECDVTGKNYYIKNIKGYNVKILTADMGASDSGDMREELNKCLEDNIIDPREWGHPNKISLDLTYTPTDPLNDSTGDGLGDVVTVTAAPENASRSQGTLYYEWEVQRSNDFTANPERWLSDAMGRLGNNLLTPIAGNGQSKFSFKLNIVDDSNDPIFDEDGITYFRVRATASETYDRQLTREGIGSVVIKVVSSDRKITAHVVDATDGGQLTTGAVICDDTLRSKSLCFVARNEVIGLSLDYDLEEEDLRNFRWSVNGQEFLCDAQMSTQCDNERQGNVNFLPVTGKPGETYTVSVSATDVSQELTDTNEGRIVELSRTFMVVDPSMSIFSNDDSQVWPKYLGDYKDLDGNLYSDDSKDVFQTFLRNDASFRIEFLPSFIGSSMDYAWFVDGARVAENVDTIDLSVDKGVGDVYHVSLRGTYLQNDRVRKALRAHWGVSQFDSTEINISSDVLVEVVGEAETAFLDNPGTYMANLLSYTPRYFLFLLRMVLAGGTLLFVAFVMMSFSYNARPSRS